MSEGENKFDKNQKKFWTTKKDLRKTLNEFGVAVIPNILDENEIEKMNSGVWDCLEHVTQDFESPMDRKDETTWRSYFELSPLHGMMLKHWQVGHAQHVWDIRQNPKVVDVFSTLWKVPPSDLICSFDGFSFLLPLEKMKRGYERKSWFHCDQSYLRNDFESVQSWVTGYDVFKGDPTLRCLLGSHKYHKEVQKEFNVCDKADWFKLSPEMLDFYIKKKGVEDVRIQAPKGSMVFWDSRTIHYGCRPGKDEQREPSLFRNVVYVCMHPRALANEKILAKRVKHFEDRRMTNHWPYKPKLNPKTPRTYGNPLPKVREMPQPNLTELGRSLVGYPRKKRKQVDDESTRKRRKKSA